MIKYLSITLLVFVCWGCQREWRQKYEEVVATSSPALFAVQKNNLWGLVDEKGREVAPMKYDFLNTSPAEDTPYYDVSIGNLWGILDAKGKEIIPVQYELILYTAGVFIAKKEGKVALLDVHNKTLTPWYDGLNSFSHGLALTLWQGKYGFINPEGKVCIPFMYERGIGFNKQGKAILEYKGKWGMIDTQNNIVIPFEYNQTEPYNLNAEGPEDYYFLFLKDGKKRYINSNGKFIK